MTAYGHMTRRIVRVREGAFPFSFLVSSEGII